MGGGDIKHAWFRVPNSHLLKFTKNINAGFPSYAFLQCLNLTSAYLTRICNFCSAILRLAGSMEDDEHDTHRQMCLRQ